MTPWIYVKNSPTLARIREDWLALLADSSALEPRYHEFLSRHASFLFQRNWNREDLMVSEVRLGAEHKIDFVRARSERSLGFVYTLIELETPHVPAFTGKGDPSARLTHALQQVRMWRAWLAEHVSEAKRLFPSKRFTLHGEAQFEYMVIIGRREESTSNASRNVLSEDSGVEIRSFDQFTDELDDGLFSSIASVSNDRRSITPEQRNILANPFRIALSDPEWRRFISSPDFELKHMIGHNVASLLPLLRFNDERQLDFLRYLDSKSPDERKIPAFEYANLTSS